MTAFEGQACVSREVLWVQLVVVDAMQVAGVMQLVDEGWLYAEVL